MEREALKLALEALGWADGWRPQGLKDKAISAIKDALAQPSLEQNFCPRCGKRTKDIHTCTPPSQENT